MTAAIRPAAQPAAWRVLLDDAQAIATGSLLAALALLVFRDAGLVPGGTMGLALLLHRATGADLALVLLAANAPFYLLALATLGPGFTGRTLVSVLLAALLTHLLPAGLTVNVAAPLLGALVGGLLCGLAMLVLFRHRSSLGGLNIVILSLQQRFGWAPVRVQLAVDACIIGAGAWLNADLQRTLASLLAVATLNAVLALNHRRQGSADA